MNFDIYTKELLTLDIGLIPDILNIIASYTRDYIDVRYLQDYFNARELDEEDASTNITDLITCYGISKYLCECISEPFYDRLHQSHILLTLHKKGHPTNDVMSCLICHQVRLRPEKVGLSNRLEINEVNDLSFFKRLYNYKVVSDEVKKITGTFHIDYDEKDDTFINDVYFEVFTPLAVENIILTIRKAFYNKWFMSRVSAHMPCNIKQSKRLFKEFLWDLTHMNKFVCIEIRKVIYSEGVLYLDITLYRDNFFV